MALPIFCCEIKRRRCSFPPEPAHCPQAKHHHTAARRKDRNHAMNAAIWSELLDAASKCQRSSWPKCLNLLQSSIPVHFEGLCQLQARCMTCFLGVAIVAKGSLSFVIGHCSLYRVFPVFVCVFSLCAVSPLFVALCSCTLRLCSHATVRKGLGSPQATCNMRPRATKWLGSGQCRHPQRPALGPRRTNSKQRQGSGLAVPMALIGPESGTAKKNSPFLGPSYPIVSEMHSSCMLTSAKLMQVKTCLWSCGTAAEASASTACLGSHNSFTC